MPTVEDAIIELLRGGQTRSIVELVTELAVSYSRVKKSLEHLEKDDVVVAEEIEGQEVYRLKDSEAAKIRPTLAAVKLSVGR